MRSISAMDRSHELHGSQLISSVVLFLFLLVVVPQVSGCHEHEREALLKFKHGGLYDPANMLSSWMGKNCCSWAGVGCSSTTGRVVLLDLPNTNLNKDGSLLWNCSLGGKIDSSLIHLQHLRYLDLSGNNFSTMIHIPEYFGSFEHLEYLNLSSANFGGKIPHQLGNLSNLHTLDLGYNYPSPVDNLSWLSSLSSLQYLDLSKINISKAENWVQEINQLSSLTELHLQNCGLPKIHSPFPFPNLTTSLNVLDLSNNDLYLSEIAHWLTTFQSLMHLYLPGTKFHGSIPPAIGNLTYLEVLDLSNNFINGTVPKSFSNLCHLRILNLASNSISGMERLPRCLSNRLEKLNLRGNELEENLHVWLGEISDSKTLKTLDVSANLFSDYITWPSEWVLPFQLEELFLGGNKFSGDILQSIGKLSNLVILDISNNFFPIVITEDVLTNLERLERIYLADNQLVWRVNSRWLPPNIRELDMSSCQVGPKFPLWLQLCKDIDILYMFNASISDDFPDWFWKIAFNMEYLFLSDNQLRGNLPNGTISKLQSLHMLDLSNNSFSGSIPTDLCMLENLERLDLSRNHFQGNIPDCWEKRGGNLRYIDLSNNNLSGEFPRSLSDLPFLEFLHLNNNSLSGEISSRIKSMKNLVFLDLSYNRLSGTIPAWDVGRYLLRILSLRSNTFHGNIPWQISHLSSLQFLDLSHNNLSGAIPASFGNFTAMARIHNKTDQIFRDCGLQDILHSYGEALRMTLKGVELEISGTLGFMNHIDLSSNNLSGYIPRELMHTVGLVGLNLSSNSLEGHIPNKIGALKQLESLDLSKNKLSGKIPSGISMLSFLSKLNLSYNNLSGKIPFGFQLQTLNDSSIYVGNDNLCGPPLQKKCPAIETPQNDMAKGGTYKRENDDESEILWLFISAMLGFMVGFWGFCGVLIFKRSWRNAYCQFSDDIIDKVIVKMAVWYARLQRKFMKSTEI